MDRKVINNQKLLENLKTVNWEIAVRVFGNDHATLIGLLVTWWISGCPETRWVLEGAPSYEENSGKCDAILCENSSTVGIVEVEGSKPNNKIDNIRHYFEARKPEFGSLEFAILLLYPYELRGKGQDRKPRFEGDELAIMNSILKVTRTYPEKAIIVVKLHKVFEQNLNGIRTCNNYYKSKVTNIDGILYEDGKEVAKLTLFGGNDDGCGS